MPSADHKDRRYFLNHKNGVLFEKNNTYLK